jgi:cyclopropane-fatty-acyl-phospholipid synthase
VPRALERHHRPDAAPAPLWRWKLRARIELLLQRAGIEIDGARPTDIQVHDERLYERLLAQGSLGLGEAYMDGWWDVRDLEGFMHKVLAAGLDRSVGRLRDVGAWLYSLLVNRQRRSRAFEVGERHYDLDNALYEAMLDRRMIYSCAYWENATTLDAAQEAKLDLVFGKLGLAPGQRVLDVGCGWGGALRYAVEKYGVHGVGITVAREQVEYAQRAHAGLPVEIRLQDYRDLDGTFDHIWSIGMFEHVGVSNYRRYMQVIRHCLAPGGRFLLHSIGSRRSTNHTDPWIDRYIFPNSMLPSEEQIRHASGGLFELRHWQRIGRNYERTLRAWRANFERYWVRIGARDERFRRMWTYYLSSSAAAFRVGKLDVWQVLLERR